MWFCKSLIVLFLALGGYQSFAQTDTLVFTNGNYMTGEIKSMDKGVLLMKTDYSDDDFKIEWDKIKFLYSKQNFYFTLESGKRVLGKLKEEIDFAHITVLTSEGPVRIPLDEITEVKTYDNKFIDRVNASIDFGYSFTKANSLEQLTLRSNLGYTATKWRLNFTTNRIQSSQDDVEETQRFDGSVGFDYFLAKNWFIGVKYNFLSNDEQQLRLRSVLSASLGKHIIKSNTLYWSLSAGGAYNIEDFIPEDQPDQTSAEGLVSSELNIFSMDDLSLLTNINIYPSLTESGRIRSDFVFDIKYDLPFDFYIGMGVSINYDNQPTEGGSDVDYVFQTTLGWSL